MLRPHLRIQTNVSGMSLVDQGEPVSMAFNITCLAMPQQSELCMPSDSVYPVLDAHVHVFQSVCIVQSGYVCADGLQCQAAGHAAARGAVRAARRSVPPADVDDLQPPG